MFEGKKMSYRYVLIAAVLCVWGSERLVAQGKIGYVDSQKILSNYAAVVDAQRQLDAENDKWDKELQQMNNELNVLQEELDQQSLLLSEAKKKEKAQELQAMVLKIQQYQTDKWGDGGQYFRYRDTLLKPVYDTINQTIRTIGEEEGYDFIFDSIAGNILYGKVQFNITEQVLEELRKGTTPSEQMEYRE